MAAHSSILAWRIPWTEESSRHSSWGHKELDVLIILKDVCNSYEGYLFFQKGYEYIYREREKRKQNQGNRQGEKQKEKSYTWQIFKVCQFR